MYTITEQVQAVLTLVGTSEVNIRLISGEDLVFLRANEASLVNANME